MQRVNCVKTLGSRPVTAIDRNLSSSEENARLQEGRVDLRGHRVNTDNSSSLRGLTWNGVDLRKADLTELRIFDCTFIDCLFDEATCARWQVFNSTFTNCSFQQADLRGAALGLLQGADRNVFSQTSFAGADFRQTTFESAVFQHCTFDDAKLKKVAFNGSVFEDCRFAGRLIEVQFAKVAVGHEELPPNAMVRVDFTQAELKLVQFVDLEMSDVRWPISPNHVLLENYRKQLSQITAHLDRVATAPALQVAHVLGNTLRSGSTGQQRGVVSRHDFRAFEADSLFEASLSAASIKLAP